MRNMQGQSFISRVNFQTSKHHKQLMRQQIRPELFQKLEVCENPAKNYINAYKNVFKDELEKTMEEHYNKKMRDQSQIINDKIAYSLNPPAGHLPGGENFSINPLTQRYGLEKSSSVPQLSPTNNSYLSNNNSYGQSPKFRDYFEERTNKFQNLVKNNFDGGQQFFKVQDAYYEKRMKQTQNYAELLRKQLQEKQCIRISERQKENMERIAAQERINYQDEIERQKQLKAYEMKHNEGIMKLNEMEQERIRRNRKTNPFQYNNISLHNPITNPIQYHIDNPYILKKIQDKTFR